MKVKTKMVALVALAAIPAVGFVAQNVYAADPVAAPLVDKEFETALRKFITKRFYNRIDATDAQREKLDQLLSTTQEETRPLREQLRRQVLKVSELMASKDATDDQIKAQIEELRALKEKVNDKRVETLLAVRKVLTDEQRTKIHDRLSEFITGGGKPKRIGMLMNLAAAE